MPTLRVCVFSSHTEHAAILAEALQQQGYQVEVVDTEASPTWPADLEIVLETCKSANLLRRTTELAAELDADVAIASGALTVGSLPAGEKAFPLEVTPDADIGSRLATILDMPPAVHNTEDHAQQEEVRPHAKLPSFWGHAIPTVAVTLSEWTTTAREILASAREQAREHKEHALTRIASIRAGREERLLELAHRRIEAEERASRLRTARRNATTYLQQLRQQSNGGIQPSGQESSPQESARGATPRRWRELLGKLLERIRPLRWDTALAGLASAGALFAIGLAVASFNSKSALSADQDHAAPAVSSSTAETAPQPSAAKPSPSAARPVPVAHLRTSKPSPAQHARSGRDRAVVGSDAATNDVTIRHLSSPSPTPRTQAQGWKHFSDMDH
ncbi:MAG TPA: hypothetical protein VIX19_15170 [Terriglobales bacterium]